jgi:hypothetical protein
MDYPQGRIQGLGKAGAPGAVTLKFTVPINFKDFSNLKNFTVNFKDFLQIRGREPLNCALPLGSAYIYDPKRGFIMKSWLDMQINARGRLYIASLRQTRRTLPQDGHRWHDAVAYTIIVIFILSDR